MMRLVVFAFLTAMLGGTLAVVPSKSIFPGQQIDKFLYTSDTSSTLRTRDDAKKYCTSRGGYLAAITTDRIYNVLRATINVQGTYWIDGIENDINLEPFGIEAPGVNYCGAPTLIKLPIDTTVLNPNRKCLSLRLPGTAGQPNIEPIPCTTRARVLCATNLEAC